MTIDALVAMAEAIHDAEGWDLGAGSSRETRNVFWARVVGCAHHGHPVWNRQPDPRWHLKNGGGGRPQSDDVAVLMPSRAYWDCIGGVGADGYIFRAAGHPEPLPAGQEVYPPPVPDGAVPVPPPVPPPVPVPPPSDTAAILAKLEEILTLIDTVVDEQAAQRALWASQQELVIEAVEHASQSRAWSHEARAALAAGFTLEAQGSARWIGTVQLRGTVTRKED